MIWFPAVNQGSVGCRSVAECNCWTCVSSVLPFPSVREGNLKINATTTRRSSETAYDCADLFCQIDIFTFVFFSLVVIPASTLYSKAAGSKVSAFFFTSCNFLKIDPVRATLMNSNEIAPVFWPVFLWLLIRPGARPGSPQQPLHFDSEQTLNSVQVLFQTRPPQNGR